MRPHSTSFARREFLRFLAASPYVAALGGVAAYLERSPLIAQNQASTDVIASADARRAGLRRGGAAESDARPLGSLVSGVDDDVTLRAGGTATGACGCRGVSAAYQGHAGRVVQHYMADLPVRRAENPFTPTANSVARASARDVTMPVRRIHQGRASTRRSNPGVYSSTPRNSRGNGAAVAARQAAGCSVALTVSNTTGRNSETYLRTRRKNLYRRTREGGPGGGLRPMTPTSRYRADAGRIRMDWAFVDRLRKSWKGKLIIKGNRHTKMPRWRSNTASAIRSNQWTFHETERATSKRCRKSWPKCADGFRCSSTAVCAAAHTSSSWPLARAVIGRPFFGASGTFGRGRRQRARILRGG
jgi:hypothetical protein